MSSESTLLFFGLRREPDEVELNQLSTERWNPLAKACRAAKLDLTWGNFGSPGEKYYVFIGKKLGALGWEDKPELSLVPEELEALMRETSERLRAAGFEGSYRLWVTWRPD